MHRLKYLIIFEDLVDEDDKKLAKEADLTLITLSDLMAKGKEYKAGGNSSTLPPGPDDIMAFSYTSGTTGDPEGVKLSQKMILGVGYAINSRLKDKRMTNEDCYISYLPAAHSFELGLFGMALLVGMKVGFFSGDILKLTEDMRILKPTFFPSVPRLFNRIYGKI